MTTLGDRDDRCEINSLYIDGQCASSQFCVRSGADYTILKIGYDEAFARLGPGQVLLDRTLKHCCADPAIERLDLVTDAPWCQDWQTSRTPMRQVHIAIGRWGGRPLVALLKFRFGRGRRIARWLRDNAEAARQSAKRRRSSGNASENPRSQGKGAA